MPEPNEVPWYWEKSEDDNTEAIRQRLINWVRTSSDDKARALYRVLSFNG